MSRRRTLENARAFLLDFDPADVAAKIGALGTLPANAPVLSTLGLASSIVASLPATSRRGKRLSAKRLAKWLDGLGKLHPALIESQEFDDLFTESFAFDGGPFLVFTGITEDSVFTLRHACKALFKGSFSFGNEGIQDELYRLVTATLTLSDLVVRSVGLDRNQFPDERDDGSCVVPPGDFLDRLSWAVRLVKPELQQILGSSIEALDHISTSFGAAAPLSLDDSKWPTLLRPVLATDREIVVVAPSHLLTSLLHAILRCIRTAGAQNDFTSAFRRQVFLGIVDSLGLLGHRPLDCLLQPHPLQGERSCAHCRHAQPRPALFH